MIIDFADQMSIDAGVFYCLHNRDVLKIGVTSGCFDTLHYYHLVYLMRCKQMCDALIVGVDSDRKIRSEKGPDRPIVNERHRLTMVNSLKYVDACFILDSLDQFEQACNLFLDVVDEEDSFVFRNQEWVGREEEVLRGKTNAQIVIIPDIEELTSTSEMIKKIEQQALKRKG